MHWWNCLTRRLSDQQKRCIQQLRYRHCDEHLDKLCRPFFLNAVTHLLGFFGADKGAWIMDALETMASTRSQLTCAVAPRTPQRRGVTKRKTLLSQHNVHHQLLVGNRLLNPANQYFQVPHLSRIYDVGTCQSLQTCRSTIAS